MRVASLLPSATELLCAIPGGRPLLVARSHECDFPPGLDALPVLTAQRTPTAASPREIDHAVRTSLDPAQGDGPRSLYTLDEAALAALKPDLILTQDLCHVCSIDLAAVRSVVSRIHPAPALLSLNPQTLEDVLDDLLRVGRAADLDAPALDTVVRLRARLNHLSDYVNPFDDGPSLALLEWTDPLFIAGHWTPQLIERAGARHPLNPTAPIPGSGAAVGPQQAARKAGKSVTVPPEVLLATKPERLVIAPCGVPLARNAPPGTTLTVESCAAQLAEQPWFDDLPAVRHARAGRATVALVDGNQMFNRPGPRLVDAFAFLVGWLQGRPELIPGDFPWAPWPG